MLGTLKTCAKIIETNKSKAKAFFSQPWQHGKANLRQKCKPTRVDLREEVMIRRPNSLTERRTVMIQAMCGVSICDSTEIGRPQSLPGWLLLGAPKPCMKAPVKTTPLPRRRLQACEGTFDGR